MNIDLVITYGEILIMKKGPFSIGEIKHITNVIPI